MTEKTFGKGEVVFREGETGTCFYQVVDGTAGVYVNYGKKDEKKLADVKPGQYFGELAIIEAWPRSGTVVAEEELRTIELTGKDLVSYFQEQPDKIIALMNQLGGRIRALTAEYDEVQAFIREKEDAEAPKKESFLARLRKYKEYGILGSKLVSSTVEDQLRRDNFGKAAEAALPVREYAKGQIIFRDGDESLYMYQIHSGSVGIYDHYGKPDQVKLTTLYTNAFFGEMGLISNEPRSAAAVVEENATVLEAIRAEDLAGLAKSNPLKLDMIMSHLANRLRRLTVDYVKACDKATEGL